MVRSFGHRSRFALEIDENGGPGPLRVVDVWAADRWLTCDDNTAYLPQFIGSLERTVRVLLADPADRDRRRPYPELSATDNFRRLLAAAESGDNGEYLAFRFMDWGPTADNVSATLFRESDSALMPFAFWREAHHDPTELGKVFVAELPWLELVRVIHEAAWYLMWNYARPG